MSFNAPILNDKGQVGFRASLTGTAGGTTDDRIILRADGTSLLRIAREGQFAGDGRRFGELEPISLNKSGQVSLLALEGTAGNFDIYLGDATAAPTPIARSQQPPPGGSGVFYDFEIPDLNDAGQLAFRASLDPASGSGGVKSGIYVGNGTTTTEIVQTGQPAPNGDGEFFSISPPTMNDTGQAAFSSFLSNTSGGSSNDRGIFRGDGTTLVEIVRENDPAPDRSGFLRPDDRVAINAAGQVAFRATIFGPNGPVSGNRGLFIGDGTTLNPLVRKGNPAPDGNGVFSSFVGELRLNDAGHAAFRGSLSQTDGGSSDDSGIFRVDSTSLGVVQIARQGDPALDGNGIVDDLLGTDIAINDRGQIALTVKYVETGGGQTDDRALLFYDDALGLMQIAREGDSFLGSTITELSFFSVSRAAGNEENGFNEIGQVAYSFFLADGRGGIALFTPIPEPTTGLLLSLGCLSATACARSERARDSYAA